LKASYTAEEINSYFEPDAVLSQLSVVENVMSLGIIGRVSK